MRDRSRPADGRWLVIPVFNGKQLALGCRSRSFRQEKSMTRLVRLVAVSLFGLSVVLPHHAFAQNATLRISTTERLITTNPYGDSNGQMYSIWCQVYGCLGVYDWQRQKYVGMLAESWEVVGPTTWRFHLRTDLGRHDGGPPPTARDVLHAFGGAMAVPRGP